MAGPDLPRPPIEQQLGSGVAGQQKDESTDVKIPFGNYVSHWEQGRDRNGKFLATGIVSRPAGGDIVVESVKLNSEGFQTRPLGSHASSLPAAAGV